MPSSICSIILASLIALAAASADAQVADALARYQTLSGVSVTGLDKEALTKLESGDTIYQTVRMTDSENSGSTILRIVGYRLIQVDRESLWLAALAYDGNYSSRLTEHLVSTHQHGDATWYQHIDMPWPLRDRHWLIRTGKNTALAAATDNRIWEHRWSLEQDSYEQIRTLARNNAVRSLSSEDFRKSIMLPRNNGAWVMMELAPRSTLVVLHATMDMGGIIPDSLVARSTRKQLRKMLEKIERDSATSIDGYDGSYPIYRGDGTLISPQTRSDNPDAP
ncbi:MAG: hypothetical protein AAAFM81_13450 [Pseudomonadota bacterium]